MVNFESSNMLESEKPDILYLLAAITCFRRHYCI